MKKVTWILFSGFIFSAIMLSAQHSGSRETVYFDEDWKFHFGNAADPAKDFDYRVANIYSKSGYADNSAIAPGFKDEDWMTVQLPHDWVVGLPFVNSPDHNVKSHGYKPVGDSFLKQA